MQTESVSDEALMLAYCDGDAAAFDTLYGRHRAGLHRFIRRQVADGGAVDEIFQDVWMRAIDARDAYEPRAKFGTWLYTIAHNRMMDFFRSMQRGGGAANMLSLDDDGSSVVIDLADGLAALPDTELARKQLARHILAALDTLSPVQREAFLLQQEGDLSIEEIAQATGVSRETAKSRLRYALTKLRHALAPQRRD